MSLNNSIFTKLFPALAQEPAYTPAWNPDIPIDTYTDRNIGRDPEAPTWDVNADTPQTQPTDLPSPGLERPAYPSPAPSQPKPTWQDQHPEYKDPYENPQNEGERAANLLARNQETIRNPIDQNHGTKGRIKEVIDNFLYGLSQAPEGSSVKQALLLGGVGAAGSLNHKWNEKRRAMMDAPMLERQVKLANDQAEADANTQYKKAAAQELLGRPAAKLAEIKARGDVAIDRLNRNADIKAGLARPIINEDGYVELQYLNADAKGQHRPNELLKGADGQPVFVPGEQGLAWQDPLTGTTTILKAKQTAIPDATAAGQNANREQDALKTNAQNNLKAQTETVNHLIQWQNNVTNQLNTALSVDTTLQNNAVVQGLNQEVQGKQQILQQLLAEPLDGGASDSEIKTRADRINKLSDDIFEANNKILAEVGKSEGGQAKANALRANLPARPPKVTYTPYKAVKVGGGVTGGGHYSGQVFASPESLQQYFPGKSAADIKAIVEAQGGKFQR